MNRIGVAVFDGGNLFLGVPIVGKTLTIPKGLDILPLIPGPAHDIKANLFGNGILDKVVVLTKDPGKLEITGIVLYTNSNSGKGFTFDADLFNLGVGVGV